MKRRVNIYLSDTADDILISILSFDLRKKVKTSQSKIIEDALIYYYEQKIADEMEVYNAKKKPR